MVQENAKPLRIPGLVLVLSEFLYPHCCEAVSKIFRVVHRLASFGPDSVQGFIHQVRYTCDI